MNDILLHASHCEGECSHDLILSQSCETLKQTLQHIKNCRVNECNICKYVNQLIQSHAAHCTLEVCPVINCTAVREIANLQQLLTVGGAQRLAQMGGLQKDPVTLLQIPPKSPEKNRGLQTSFHSPIKNSLKCTRCNHALTENHTCTSIKPILFPNAAVSPPHSPPYEMSRFQLSPMRKRSFDAWSENETSTSSNTSPSFQGSALSEVKGDELSTRLFEDDDEVINLPCSSRTPKKLQKIENNGKRGSRSKPRWSSFSFHESFMKPKGHLKDESIGKKENNNNNIHSRANSWNGFANSFVENALGWNSIAPKESTVPIPSTMAINPTLSTPLRSPSVVSEQTDATTTSENIVEENPQGIYHRVSTGTVEGVGLTDSEELDDLDLSLVVLDLNENQSEWQSLMIYTPTSRNRLDTRHRKPVEVKETIFEEKEVKPVHNPVLIPSVIQETPLIDENTLADIIEMAERMEDVNNFDQNNLIELSIMEEVDEEEEVFRFLNNNTPSSYPRLTIITN